jgi:hypothetical protein
MKCDNRLLTAKEVPTTQGVKTATLGSLVSVSDRKVANKFAVLLVNVPTTDGNTQMFRATLNTQVPLNTEIIRSQDGQIVGIPAVSGG